jgi:hypothetical protein
LAFLRVSALEISLDEFPYVPGAIPDKSAELHEGTAFPEETISAGACYASACDVCVLILIKKRFYWWVSYVFAFAGL